MLERPPGPGPGEVNNAPPQKNQFFCCHQRMVQNFLYFFVAICVWYKPSIPYKYHMSTMQTVHTIHVWYKIFYLFFCAIRFICTIRSICTICLPYMYGTKFF